MENVTYHNILFMDIVGFSRPKWYGTIQVEKIQYLTNIVRTLLTELGLEYPQVPFLHTGDGMALFFENLEHPIKFALKLTERLNEYNETQDPEMYLELRIGIHSGYSFPVRDLHNQGNRCGPTINTARRVMDLGERRHILCTHVYGNELIRNFGEAFKSLLHDCNTYTVKHGEEIKVYNVYNSSCGNSTCPYKSEEALQEPSSMKKSREQLSKTETVSSMKRETQEINLLPDSDNITDLRINNNLLNQIYEEAQNQATIKYKDAQLRLFIISVNPFHGGLPKVLIHMIFYSELASRSCTFLFDGKPPVRHTTPDRHVKNDEQIEVFDVLPWNKSSHWMQFLNLAYFKIGPLPKATSTSYSIYARPPRKLFKLMPWRLVFEDGVSGRSYEFEWSGGDIDNQNIKQTS